MQLLPCCHHLPALMQSRTLRVCRHQPACHPAVKFLTAGPRMQEAQYDLLTTLRQRDRLSWS